MIRKNLMTKKATSVIMATCMCGLLMACGSAASGNTADSKSEAVAEEAAATDGTEAAAESDTYTVDIDNFETWDYSFVNINAFGDTPGVGMINIQSWGNKKLALGSDGTCDGEGCSWTIQLDVDGNEYALYTIAHIVGAGDVYEGSGDFTYKFIGTCEAADDGYVLDAPTDVEVSLTGDFTRLSDGSDFADYIPSAPASVTSNDADDSEAAAAFGGKVVPSYLVSTVFGGGIFHVDGNEIVSVTDINFPEI